jgi:hypothetical protein
MRITDSILKIAIEQKVASVSHRWGSFLVFGHPFGDSVHGSASLRAGSLSEDIGEYVRVVGMTRTAAHRLREKKSSLSTSVVVGIVLDVLVFVCLIRTLESVEIKADWLFPLLIGEAVKQGEEFDQV